MTKKEISILSSQVYALTLASMKARYRKTVAGFLWVVLNPIIMYSVQSFVFRKLLKIDVPNYSTFLLCGLLPWIFITMTIDMATPILESSAEILKSFKVNPFVFILSQVLDNFFNFIFAFCIILIPLWFVSGPTLLGLVLLPFALLFLLVGVVSFCWSLSFMQVFYKDIRFVMSFATSILFFMTPIFYPLEFIPDHLKFIVKINPIYALIEPFRYCLYQFEMTAGLLSLGKSFLVCFLMSVFAVFIWRKKKNDFYLSL